MASLSVLPTSVPSMTVTWFAVSRILQGVEAGNWGYDGTTKVNLKSTSPPHTPDEVHFVSIPDLEHNHVPQRLSLFDRFYRFVYSFQGVSSRDELI